MLIHLLGGSPQLIRPAFTFFPSNHRRPSWHYRSTTLPLRATSRDPEIRHVGNNTAVCNFGLAINRRFRDSSGEQKDDTTFVDIEAWGRTAEICGQYLQKGRNVFIEGSLKLDQWEDKEGKRQVAYVSAPLTYNSSVDAVKAATAAAVAKAATIIVAVTAIITAAAIAVAATTPQPPATAPPKQPGFDGGLDDEPPF